MARTTFLNRTGSIGLMLAAAFFAGIFVSGLWQEREQPQVQLREETGGDGGRNLYSPSIATDPAFRAQQRTNVEALEAHCENTGEFCEEAQSAREAFTRLGKRD